VVVAAVAAAAPGNASLFVAARADGAGAAQEVRMTGDDQSPLAGTEVHYLRSEHVGDEFKIFVGHCSELGAGAGLLHQRAKSDGAPPVVLYVSDANGLFASAVDIIRLMQLAEHLPPILVVGIGYRMGALGETVGVRTRDFTPTSDPLIARISPAVTLMGGAERFSAFIRDELQPWVRSRYRVDADDSAYFGHSLGGLFGTYVLVTNPATFRRYGIGSPSLWWDNDIMFEYEATYAKTHDDLPAKVFFTVGAFEDHDGRQREASRLSPDERAKAGLRYIDMVADTERLAASLRTRQYPNLDIATVVLPDEFHVTVAHLNLSRSLRYLFDAPS
jgi:predicted alpha/beta superfamily hydrolase